MIATTNPFANYTLSIAAQYKETSIGGLAKNYKN